MNNNRSGFILIQAIVSLGLIVLLSYMMSTSLNKSLRTSRGVELRGELETIRRNIVTNLSCKDTTGSKGFDSYAACAGKDYTQELKNHNGKPLFQFEADGKTIKGSAGYIISAVCKKETEGLVFSYTRMRDEKVTKDPVYEKTMDWTNLFPSDGGVTFCQEYFSPKVSPTRCNGDEVMRGIGPDGEPQCESIYEAADFQVCIQFSDHRCTSQRGATKCTECMKNLSQKPDAINLSDWASDANKNNPDCARLFLKKCEAAAVDEGDPESTWEPKTTSKSGCNAVCADNEMMVGINTRVDGGGSQTCTIWCRDTDSPVGGLGYASDNNSSPAAPPECPPPLEAIKVMGSGKDCGKKCTQILRQAKQIILNYSAQLKVGDQQRVDPFIGDLKKNKGNLKDSAKNMFEQIKSAASFLGCDPLANTPFKLK